MPSEENQDWWKIAIACLLFYYGTTALFPKDRTKEREDELAIKAFLMSQRFVQQDLKAVSTAEFPEYNASDVQTIEGGYCVSSYVDAENSFGAKLRTNYVCKLRHSNGRWFLEGLRYY